MLKEDQIVVTNEDGTEIVCNILFTHEANDKSYVVFEFADSEEISAAIFEAGDTEDEGTFIDIETDEEWEMLDTILQKFFDELDDEEDVEDVEETQDLA